MATNETEGCGCCHCRREKQYTPHERKWLDLINDIEMELEPGGVLADRLRDMLRAEGHGLPKEAAS